MKWNKKTFSKNLKVDEQILYKDRQHNIDSNIEIDLQKSIQTITTVPNGENIILSVELINDDNKYSFQWFKSIEDDQNKFQIIQNETKSRLKLTKINAFSSDQNLFKCVITNSENNQTKELVTKLQVINPEIEIISPTYSKQVLSLGKPTTLNIEANIANNELNPKWKIEYQWVYWKNNTWNKFVNSNNISGVKTANLKFKKLDYSLIGLKIGCVLNVSNVMNDDSNTPHINTVTHLSIDQPEIDKLTIWSNDVSDLGYVKIDSTPILSVKAHFKNYLKLPDDYSLQYRWLIFKNNDWVVTCKDQIFVLEKQNRKLIETKIKVNVSVLNKQNQKVSTFTSDILNIKVNPNINIKKEWESLTLLKNQTFSLKTTVKIKHSRKNSVGYQWHFNNKPISSENPNYRGQNTNILTIINPIINDSGNYKLSVNVNGVDYDSQNNITPVTVMDNRPIITNLEYSENIVIEQPNKSFKVKVNNIPKVNYELPLGFYKINWFIKKGNESEYQLISSKSGIKGFKTPTLKFRKFPTNTSQVYLMFKVSYVNKQDQNLIYSEYISNDISIQLKQN